MCPVPAQLLSEPVKKSKPSTAAPAPSHGTKTRAARGATAEEMASRQRDISVSEFFAKNRHLLGFDNPRKALLTTVKEAVDNSLDACEEAGILPDIAVVIEDLQPDRPATAKSSRYRVTVVDNGPGIVRKQVENIFGRLLYGSKFHRLKMSRGQQGIGISAAGMYGLITTGRPMVIHTKPNLKQPAHHIELAMNTKTNRAEVTVDDETGDFPPARLRAVTAGAKALAAEGVLLSSEDFRTGTSVSIELEGRYQKGRGSVDEFLELTAIANPHARVVFVPPSRSVSDDEDVLPIGKSAPVGTDAATAPSVAVTTEINGAIHFPRGVQELPPETKEIQPHPKGIELGILLQMLKDYEVAEKGGTLYQFLQDRFCRISASTASAMCTAIKCTSRTKVADIEPPQAEALFKQFQEVKLPPPPTDCLAPIGVRQLLAGMLKGVRAEFYAASSREAEVYRGRPFQIEAAIAFGGELPAEETARVIRFANRVPLLFQQSACSSFKAVTETAWRNYNLSQPRGSLPLGPLVIMIHMASVWVPFTSESKEAIADYDEIRKEMKLALMECGRKLGTYLRKRQKMRREGERRDVFARYIGEIAKAINALNGADAKRIYEKLLEQARERTAVADQQLDEDGKLVKEDERDIDGVIIVDHAIAPVSAAPTGVAEPPDEPAEPSGRSSRKRKTAETPSLF
ncbi:MAG: DNA topoisomerase VI subunit B [Phycisphaerae bacterium]|nr:DNA topoisomerase VI subunit B [Phycisphaerae bacterium]